MLSIHTYIRACTAKSWQETLSSHLESIGVVRGCGHRRLDDKALAERGDSPAPGQAEFDARDGEVGDHDQALCRLPSGEAGQVSGETNADAASGRRLLVGARRARRMGANPLDATHAEVRPVEGIQEAGTEDQASADQGDAFIL